MLLGINPLSPLFLFAGFGLRLTTTNCVHRHDSRYPVLGFVAMRTPERVGSKRRWRLGVDGPLALSGIKVEGNRVGSEGDIVAKDIEFCFKMTPSIVPKRASTFASISCGGHVQ